MYKMQSKSSGSALASVKRPQRFKGQNHIDICGQDVSKSQGINTLYMITVVMYVYNNLMVTKDISVFYLLEVD